MRRSIWLLIAMGALAACDPNRIYEENKDLDGSFWHKDSLVQFSFQIPDINTGYNLYANIRNAQHYPFYNLYYQYTLTDSSGTLLEKQLQDIHLFDPKTGEPFGAGLGDLFDHRQLLLEDYQFPEPGSYTLTLEQYMRRDSLPLILSMGARVEKAEE